MLRVSPCVHVRTHICCCVTYMLKGMEMENSQMHFYQVNTLYNQPWDQEMDHFDHHCFMLLLITSSHYLLKAAVS